MKRAGETDPEQAMLADSFMVMHDPAHPGEVIRELCLEPLGLSVTDAAKALSVTRKALSELLNGRAGVSPAMALRLARAFDTSAERWMVLQQQYDLWHAGPPRCPKEIAQAPSSLDHQHGPALSWRETLSYEQRSRSLSTNLNRVSIRRTALF